jgi:hypothetical protein
MQYAIGVVRDKYLAARRCIAPSQQNIEYFIGIVKGKYLVARRCIAVTQQNMEHSRGIVRDKYLAECSSYSAKHEIF